MPRRTSPVIDPFCGVQQFGLALHLDGRDGPLAPQKGVGVSPRGVHHVEVIEREIATAPRHKILNERGLAGLPGTRHNHRRHDPETLGQTPCRHKGEIHFIHSVNDNHS